MTRKKGKILVVEDERDIRELILLHLAREGFDTAAAEDGEKALQLWSEGSYDLTILDWMLPGISGLDLCRQMAGRAPVLMVTARADTADIVLGLEAGADDYVTKPFEIPVLLARVRALIRRASLAQGPDTWLRLGDVRLSPERHEALAGEQALKLTASEFRLLEALMANQGKVLSRQKLIGLVQGAEVNVTERTVDTHVFGLRKKLGESADLIETIRGVGYRVNHR